ncbi:MAG: sulfite exporter TauE/SafE family protein [Gammaproteobacteria bacterium]|nr:sulfite exporter TauE/SafE family protein [Gammaproteobacteria bacterium]
MDWIYLAIITLLAATIQSATGFGFGLIAVPVFLLILDSSDAIQMVMIVILCMSVVDWLKLRGQSSFKLLLWLNVGMLVGFPFGLYVFQHVELPMLKLIIALVILFFSLHNLLKLLKGKLHTLTSVDKIYHWQTTVIGYLSGLMSTSLAMPGPVVMLYLVHLGLDKTLIRATILTFFIFAYSGALLLQASIVGISGTTWTSGFSLVPVALAGVFAGHFLADKINQKLFKEIVLFILILTAIVMLLQL